MDRFALILAITSCLSLALVYFAALGVKPDAVSIGDVDSQLVGRTVSIEGYVKTEKMNDGGHLFTTITDGTNSVQVPIFSDVMQHLDEKNFKSKSKVRITGLVDDYKNQIQIVPRKPSDIVFLSR